MFGTSAPSHPPPHRKPTMSNDKLREALTRIAEFPRDPAQILSISTIRDIACRALVAADALAERAAIQTAGEAVLQYSDYLNWCVSTGKKSMLLSHFKAAWTEIAPQEAKAEQAACGACHGSGWVSRDADIGTDQECFSCGGSGIDEDVAPVAPAQAVTDSGRINWLQSQIVDTIYMDDMAIIDVQGGDVRSAIDAAIKSAILAKRAGSAGHE